MKSIDAVYLVLLLFSLFLMWEEARELRELRVQEPVIDRTFFIALGFSYINFRLITEMTELTVLLHFVVVAFWLIFFSLLSLLMIALLLGYSAFLYKRNLISPQDVIYWKILYHRSVEVVGFKFCIDLFALICVFLIFLVKG